MNIERLAQSDVHDLLLDQSAVAILGPRQVGKTTLALDLAQRLPSMYFDLEDPAIATLFREPRAVLAQYQDQLVILDEVQRTPGLFDDLRGIIDLYRREGRGNGHFLLLGSASVELIRKTSESLAGRIAYRELFALNLLETGEKSVTPLWLRGGFPRSYLARSERSSLQWRRDFILTYLERDIPAFDARTPSETLRRLWTMLAHGQGALLNVSGLAASLGIDVRTVNRYLDLLVDLLLVRRLPPWSGNVGKRLVKSPKLYLRDSGIVHALLGIADLDGLLAHPVVGASWEGFVIENILSVTPTWVQAFFYRTSGGAEIDLVLEFNPEERWVIEIKRTARNVTPRKGFYNAFTDLGASRGFVVYPGSHQFEHNGVQVVSVGEMMRNLKNVV
ncbi:MAG: ATP-binding protein [Proteobacteria bacterium]|nr:ATP-binding protein [Pseudomonadota bacterium]